MPRRNKRLTVAQEIVRRQTREAYVHALAEGRRERATVFRPAKGKGSYTRRPKHRHDYLASYA